MPRELVVVPYQRRGYVYSAVFPTTWTQQWSLALPYDRAVVLEFAPAWTDVPRTTFEPTTEQRWPQDVVRYLSTLGYEPQVDPGGVPLVRRDALRDREGVIVDYLTLALLGDGVPSTPVGTWFQLRSELQRTLLPETLSLPAQCEAVLHVAGHELAVLLARERGLVTNWLSEILATCVHGAGTPNAVKRALSRWVLRSADRQGVRIRSIQLRHASSGRSELMVVGRWGRGEVPPLQAGAVDGADFEVIIALEGDDTNPGCAKPR